MDTTKWLRAGAVGLTVGALVATGSGIATADRGGAAGSSDDAHGSSPTRGGRHATAAPGSASSFNDGPAAPAPRAAASAKPVGPRAAAASDDEPVADTAVDLTTAGAPDPVPATGIETSIETSIETPPPASVPVVTAVSVPVAPTIGKAVSGPLFGLFGDGTADHPNAGLLGGNGFSFDATTCASGSVCNGGNAGLLFGDGGNGFNGGTGGNGGFFGTHIATAPIIPVFLELPVGLYGKPGDGGKAAAGCVAAGITCNGGNGGKATSYAGKGGAGGDGVAGGNGGAGGDGGFLLGIGGDGGWGAAPAGVGGKGGKAGLLDPWAAGRDGQNGAGPEAAAKATAKANGPLFGLFGDGTADHPDAGLISGNGFSFTAETCPTGTVCNGGNAGKLWGDGGNGFNGGTGGDAGLFGTHFVYLPIGLFGFLPLGFSGKAGDGGNASANCTVAGITCNGGDGGNATLGYPGNGGNGANGGVGGYGGRGPFGFSGNDGSPTPPPRS